MDAGYGAYIRSTLLELHHDHDDHHDGGDDGDLGAGRPMMTWSVDNMG